MKITSWKHIGSLPAGGAISGISGVNDPGNGKTSGLWVCSPAGLFHKRERDFEPQIQGIPFHSASAVLSLNGLVFAAGYPNFIVYTTDPESGWFTSQVETLDAPVTCFAASPSFPRDGNILAGSDGDGILRSADGGGSWQISNFGLNCLHVLDVVCSPDWSPDVAPNQVSYCFETVAAATEAGVFLSSNAGRAWRFCGAGLPPVAILSLAFTPDFKQFLPVPSDAVYESRDGESAHFRGALFAGTDGAGLYRSVDGGKRWHFVDSFLGGEPIGQKTTVNSLLYDSQGVLLAGTGEHGIWASPDHGMNWRQLSPVDGIVLKLAEFNNQVLAGTGEHGLFVSEERGKSWQIVEDFAARRVDQLAVFPAWIGKSQDVGFGVGGFSEGVWLNSHLGWENIGDVSREKPLAPLALVSWQDSLLVLTQERLLAHSRSELVWGTILETNGSRFTTAASLRKSIYLGCADGWVRYSDDIGRTWIDAPPPAPKLRILALQPDESQEETRNLFVLTMAENANATCLWRFDIKNGQWSRLLETSETSRTCCLAFSHAILKNRKQAEIFLSIGSNLYLYEQDSGTNKRIAMFDAPVRDLVWTEDYGQLFLVKQGELLTSCDRGVTWERSGLREKSVSAVAIWRQAPQRVFALTVHGRLYEGGA